jgi:manganese/zinc/iron transport system permease protein
MFADFWQKLSGWESLDTWIAVTGALAAMACALPGTWLVLRRQSMMGDALSHAVLPGIVIAYLAVSWLEDFGWFAAPISHGDGITEGMSFVVRRQLALFVGAALSGIASAVLSELVQRWGRVERSAALGVVFTSMFALGLLLIRLFADRAHLDPGCVLYGNLEATKVDSLGSTGIPNAAVINAGMLLVNGLLVIVFFKELKLTTFDPDLAASQGWKPGVVSLVLMSVTAATVVAAFESVGAILVIAMLIVPGATARVLTDRLSTMIGLSLIVAAFSAVTGHMFALTLPGMVGSRIGLPEITDASTAGMMSVTVFGCFVLALLASPRHGAIRTWIDRVSLRMRIVREDVLGQLYRRSESGTSSPTVVYDSSGLPFWLRFFARWSLKRQQLIQPGPKGDELTPTGTEAARALVRSHRLWELYMARHFDLPPDHLHATAEQVEHFLSPEMQSELAAELDQPTTDPHGRSIPS